jgi:hypothetical protein
VAALNEENLVEEPRTARHRCQPFAGIRSDDPDFPPTYQRDPWCWSPEIGFHRSSRPDQPVTVRAAHRQRVVTKHAMRTWQAFRLGLGVGTSNAVSSTPASDVLTRPLEACDTWSGDLEPIAWYGYRCRDLTYVNDDEPARRATYVAALRFFLPGGFGHWDEVLTRAANGSHSKADVSWANPRGHDGYQRLDAFGVRSGGHRDPEVHAALLDYAAGIVFENLASSWVQHGVFRSLARLFLLTDPNEGQLTAWLLLIARTARQHAPPAGS